MFLQIREYLLACQRYTDACDVDANINDYEREVYINMIGIVFQEIATVFAPQSHSSTQEDRLRSRLT